MNIVCFSHDLDLVRTKFLTTNLDKFMKHWLMIFQHSSKAKLLWREKTDSATRWWSAKNFFGPAATDVAPKS